MGTPSTEDQIKEINQKLDSLMDFFNIGVTPRKNIREIRQWAKDVAAKVREKDNGSPPKKRPLGN
jgi:hypothetical protein